MNTAVGICEGCPFTGSKDKCTRKNGCVFVPAIIRLCKILNAV